MTRCIERRIPTLLATTLAILASGCIEISGGGGGGAMPNIISAWRREYNALRQQQATVHCVMNFYTEFSATEDLFTRLARLDKRRAIEFLSVGVERISRELLLDPGRWGIEVDLPPGSKDSSSASNTAPLDLSASARLYNFSLSDSLNWESASPTARALMEADASFSKKRIYRVSVTAYVSSVLRPERPNRVDYQVSVSAQLSSKSSSFADDDSFRPVFGFGGRKVAAWQEALAENLVATYLEYFKRQGLIVRMAPSVEGEL